MGRITGATSYEGFGDVDFVIEAVPEKMEIKKSVFAELDEVTPGHAILASNTSSLSIAEIGSATLRPDKVVGFHFFYPASVMPLVEIDRAARRPRAETVTAAFNFAQAIRKQPITCNEVPGFVVNRILNSAVGEIWRAQEEQGLSIKKIDEGVAAAQRRADGAVRAHRHARPRHRRCTSPSTCRSPTATRFYVHKGMQKLVEDGKLGAKSGGEGFYKDGEPNIEGDADPDPEELADLFTLKALVEACLMLEEGVCTVREIDLGLMAGAGLDPRRGLFPPFWKADLEGLDVDAREAREVRGVPRRALHPAADPEAAGRPGPPRSQVGPRLLRLSRRPEGEGDRQAREARRRRYRLARQPADERDLTPGDRGPRQGLGGGQVRRRDQGDGRLLLAAGRLLGRRRHQGLHPMDESGGRGADPRGPRPAARARPEPGLDRRRDQRDRLRRRLRAGDGLRLPRRRRLGDLRPARDQPRDHPRLRRHPAPAAAGRREPRRSR